MKTVQVGDIVKIGDSADNFVLDNNGENAQVPVGTTLHFTNGFLVRQYSPEGVGRYGQPSANFWTVVVTKKDEVLGIILPEGDEECFYHVEGENESRIDLIHHHAQFLPLKKLRHASSAEVKYLP